MEPLCLAGFATYTGYVFSASETDGDPAGRLARSLRPQSERASHYFDASIAGQFDVADETDALEPLPTLQDVGPSSVHLASV